MTQCMLLLILVVALVAGLSVTVTAATEVKMMEPSEFTILPWGETPGDVDVLKEIRACGFNLAGFVRPEGLDAVTQAGLRCLVIDGSVQVGDAEAQLDQAEIDKRVEALVKRVGDHKAVFGYYLRDEPSAGAFPGLGRWAAAFAKADPDALAYINLLPNYATTGQLGTPTYEEYLESFVRNVKPKFLSYDHYALMDDGSLRGGYFQNLEAMRKAALKHNLPFWNIVLSNAHFNYAEPSPAGFRFQLYTTLAYGARGISYFTYFTPNVGNYRLGPVDQFGNKTPTWDLLRNVNLQLHRLGPVYITLKSVNVFHHPNVPEGCSGMDTSLFISALSGGDLLAGEFEDGNGNPFVMVVNKDLTKSASCGISFKAPGDVQFVSPYTGALSPWVGENVWLAPGQGTLLANLPAKK